MTENIRITCLLDRYWDPATLDYAGTEQSGVLIDISMQSAVEDSAKLIPVGIVVLDANTFHSVPMACIKKATAN